MGLLWFRDLEKKQTKWYSKNWQLRVTKKCSWCWGSGRSSCSGCGGSRFRGYGQFCMSCGGSRGRICSKCNEKGQVKK